MTALALIPPAQRGYLALYRVGHPRNCPGCGNRQWHVGRVMAECAFCQTALPIEQGNAIHGTGLFRVMDGNPPRRHTRR